MSRLSRLARATDGFRGGTGVQTIGSLFSGEVEVMPVTEAEVETVVEAEVASEVTAEVAVVVEAEVD